MKVVKLTSDVRSASGSRGARRSRREGRVPAVIYGEGKAPQHVAVAGHEFRRAVDAGARVIDLAIGATEPERVLLTDVQFDAMGLRLIHADFRRMDPAHEITLRVPVSFEGAPKGLADGGVLTILRDVIAVRCLPRDIPEGFRIDVSGLALGESVEAGKVPLPEGVKLAEDAHDVIVGCTLPKLVKVEEPTAAEAAVAAEAAATAAAAAPGAAGAAGAAAGAPAAGAAKGDAKAASGGDAKGGADKKKK